MSEAGAGAEDENGGRDASRPPLFAIPRLAFAGKDQAPLGHVGAIVGRAVEWPDVEGRVGVRTARHVSGASVEIVGVARYAIDGGDLVLAWPEPGRSRAEVHSVFERSVVPLALTYGGAGYLHASAVATPGHVLALCGRSGTGKSTTAAALERRGFELWGDDAVVFSAGGDEKAPTSVRLRSSLRLDDRARHMIGAPPSGAPAPGTPGDIRPLRAVVVLERGHEAEPRLEALASGRAVSVLLEHALCLSLDDAEIRRRLVSNYLALAASVPVLRLVFAPDPGRLSSLVDLVAGRLGTSSPG